MAFLNTGKGMGIKTIITGSTGMVGEGVLHECLKNPGVESVLVINRKPCGVLHSKLIEIVHTDFFNLSSIENQLAGYDACFFCAGISSIGKSEDEYKLVTYDLTMNFAKSFAKQNPGSVFCYVSGMGTDSSENGRIMWARVKGKTENDLLKLPFKSAYMFRPAYIRPIKGLKNAYKISKVIAPFYHILKLLFPKYVLTLEEVGIAMINSAINGYDKNILECEDIRKLTL